MAWSYQDYKDNAETVEALSKKQQVEALKPGEYTQSDTVKSYYDALSEVEANKPSDYQSQWQTNINDTLNKILNRDKFTYNLGDDMLYQQYKDQYVLQGQQAMMDTMGQAAALTGGYGNSYAQTVGQQTYQGYLQQLNDKVPELYQLALNRYNQEGEDLYNQYSLFSNQDSIDYGRYRDTVSDYYTNRDYLAGRYDTEYSKDYGQYRDTVSDWQYDLSAAAEDYWNNKNFGYGQYSDNRNLSYTQYRDDISDQQYAEQLAYQKERDAVADSQWEKQYAASLSSSSGGGSSSGSGSVKTSVSDYNKILDTMKSNFTTEAQAEYYLDGLVSSGAISPETATSIADSFARTLAAGGVARNAGKSLGELNRNYGKSYQTKY